MRSFDGGRHIRRLAILHACVRADCVAQRSEILAERVILATLILSWVKRHAGAGILHPS